MNHYFMTSITRPFRASLGKSTKMFANHANHANRSVSSLVVAENSGSSLSQGTLSTITAATKLGGNVNVLITGSDIAEIGNSAASVKGVSKVILVKHSVLKNKVAEDMAKVVSNMTKGYTHILSPSSNMGKNVLPRVAALMDASPLSDVISIIDHETFVRPLYAGNAIATIKSKDPVKFLLIRSTTFDKAETTGGNATIEEVTLSDAQVQAKMSKFVSESQTKSARPDLSTSRVVVSGGRGMKSSENFAMLETLADKLGGAVGASRAAVDAGFAPNDYQVGQTGKVVAPDLYIAVGISGAIQHLSGMKDSKTIVAINKDKEAPIFQVADYGLVDDLFKVVPEISSKL